MPMMILTDKSGDGRDHKSLYVGDTKGRVYVWNVADQPGRSVVDHWVKDDGGDSCVACRVKFSFSERRHHCRNCGQLFCARLTNVTIVIVITVKYQPYVSQHCNKLLTTLGDFTFWISLSLSPKTNLTLEFWSQSEVRIS